MGVKLFIWTPGMRNEGVFKFWYGLCENAGIVSMATHSGFENGGMPTKVLISQLLLILDY